MGRHAISATNCWFIRDDNFVSDAEGQYIPGQRLELNFTSQGSDYTVLMNADPQGEWHGEYAVARGGGGKVAAKLYTAEDGSMVLVGRWSESGTDYTWLVDRIIFEENDFEEDDEEKTQPRLRT